MLSANLMNFLQLILILVLNINETFTWNLKSYDQYYQKRGLFIYLFIFTHFYQFFMQIILRSGLWQNLSYLLSLVSRNLELVCK